MKKFIASLAVLSSVLVNVNEVKAQSTPIPKPLAQCSINSGAWVSVYSDNQKLFETKRDIYIFHFFYDQANGNIARPGIIALRKRVGSKVNVPMHAAMGEKLVALLEAANGNNPLITLGCWLYTGN